MQPSVWFEMELVLLVVCSLVLPAAVYLFLYGRVSVSRWTVLAFAMLLIGVAGVDVALLQSLTEQVKSAPGLLGVQVFSDQVALVLYVLPAAFAGLGVNLLSHVLINHLNAAERRFDQNRAALRRGQPVRRLGRRYGSLLAAMLLAVGVFALDLAAGNAIRLHALYLFPLAWVARHDPGWALSAWLLLWVSALQVVIFSLEVGGMASLITDILVSLAASMLVLALARQRR